MYKIIAVVIITYITYPLVVEHGLYPPGTLFGVLYGLGIVGAFSFVEGKR